MTSEIHEAPVRWLNTEFGHMMRTGLLTAGEIELMDFGSPGPGMLMCPYFAVIFSTHLTKPIW
jgi:hypothetical protein